MRILVLGGTAFLSRTVAQEALRRGHDVTCACRGVSGPVAEGAELVVWDRSEDPPTALTEAAYDAVVDVSRIPSHVRRAVAALPDPHWVFVSTGNVYREHSARGATADRLPLLDPITTDEDPTSSPDAYGGMKVACEQLVLDGARSAMVVRSGLIVGPGDPSGRFAYWPRRIAAGGEVLAPESPDDAVQWVDVRDLAAWIVDASETRTSGVFDGVGQPVPRRRFLEEVAAGVGAAPTYSWVPKAFLDEREVAEWTGPRSVPLWVSDPDWQGFMDHDVTPSLEAGLQVRPLAETARDTLAWLRETPDAVVTGLTLDEEAEVLAAWRAVHGEPAETCSAAEGQHR